MDTTRAEALDLSGARVAIRNPVGLWILTFLTLGIWGVVWTYQVNRELRDYSRAVSRPFSNFPWLAALLFALWPLALIPALIAVVMTAVRIRTVQRWFSAGERSPNPVLAAVFFFLLFFNVHYLQKSLNSLWRRARRDGPPPADYAVATGAEDALKQSVVDDAVREAYRDR